ncbi:S-layer homology domain-containing protein [Cohnella caldifontis]|uniref:S-layer homology domain-containing protein n=1 Tax=Cohnella caldifontis TaxID=3027471 RepID=UPI0023EC6BCD|nr:S-layer homology domain-containing protein [Cohnella sp. YIM B05605]
MRKLGLRAWIGMLVLLAAAGILWPAGNANAAKITRANVIDVATQAPAAFLIAGRLYSIRFESDKAFSTSIENPKLESSVDGGATWMNVPLPKEVGGFWGTGFTLPVERKDVSVLLRFSMYFDPIVGSKTYSEKILGPYKVLQPMEISDFTATPNDDGSVTLRWNDNTNMESFYRMTRAGPDGDKTFEVPPAANSMGPLSYTDKQTNTSKSTIYVYSLTPIIDQYDLPKDFWLGTVWATAKTKVPISKLDILQDIPLVDPKLLEPKDGNGIDPNTPILNVDAFKYLDKYHVDLGDLEKPAVSGVKLDVTALALKPGESRMLVPTVTPADAANRSVAWSSDNETVAEVDATGKVTAKSAGLAKIAVKTEVGHFIASCVVTVLEDPPVPMEPAPGFPDLAGHPAEKEIAKAVELGLVSGYPDGTFRPNGGVTRAEFASMLMRGVKPLDDGAPLTFTDKDDIGAWAVKPVQQAVKLGIIAGYSDGTFRPNASISHAEMVSMVVRASGLPIGEAKKTGFADDAEIPNWVKPSVSKAEETGIIIVGGMPDGKFAPMAKTTRAEAASAIVRMLGLPK